MAEVPPPLDELLSHRPLGRILKLALRRFSFRIPCRRLALRRFSFRIPCRRLGRFRHQSAIPVRCAAL